MNSHRERERERERERDSLEDRRTAKQGKGKENLFLSRQRTENRDILAARKPKIYDPTLSRFSLARIRDSYRGKRGRNRFSKRSGAGTWRVFRSREPLGWFVARKDECVHTHASQVILHARNSSNLPLSSFALAVNFQAPVSFCFSGWLLPAHVSFVPIAIFSTEERRMNKIRPKLFLPGPRWNYSTRLRRGRRE